MQKALLWFNNSQEDRQTKQQGSKQIRRQVRRQEIKHPCIKDTENILVVYFFSTDAVVPEPVSKSTWKEEA